MGGEVDRYRVFPAEEDIHGQSQITEVRWTDTVFTPEDIHIDNARTYLLLLALSLWKGCVKRSSSSKGMDVGLQ